MGRMVEQHWEIREARTGDADAISAILTEAGVEAWGGFLGEDRIRREVASQDHPANLVAQDSEGVFAFVAWDSETGEIQRLYTHPRAWGQGAARALLQAALAALSQAGHQRAWLHTEERNTRAIAFYERQGWRRDGHVRVRNWHGAQLREPRFTKAIDS